MERALAYVRIRDAKGRRVIVTGIPGEEDHTAEVTAVEIIGRQAKVRFAGHPTCGHFTWFYPRDHVFTLNEKPAKKGVARK
jgi:hypothetical protein